MAFRNGRLVLIVVAHIDEYRIRIVDHLIDAIGLQILTDVARIEALVIDAVSHDALAHLEAQHPEGFAVVFQRDIQADLIHAGCEANSAALNASKLCCGTLICALMPSFAT